MAAISKRVSLAAHPVNTEWRLKMFRVAYCCVCKAYFTKESDLLQQVSLIQPGHIWVKFGSDPGCYPGQWVIWVSGSSGSVVLTRFQPCYVRISSIFKPYFQQCSYYFTFYNLHTVAICMYNKIYTEKCMESASYLCIVNCIKINVFLHKLICPFLMQHYLILVLWLLYITISGIVN